MLQTLVPLLALALAAGQDGKLEIAPPVGTYGYLGAKRPQGEGAIPGDVLHFTFDIRNLKLDAKGRATYSVAMEVLDSDNEPIFRHQPRNIVAQCFFGGNTLPFSSSLAIPLNAKPGVATWKVTITDRATGESVTATGKGKIRPPEFALIQVGTFADREGHVPMPPVGVVGTVFYVNFATVGFARDPGTKQPNVKATLRVLDENDRPTFAEPLLGHIHEDVPAGLQILPLQFGLTMNRTGHYRLVLEAKDEISGKTDKITLPVRILPEE